MKKRTGILIFCVLYVLILSGLLGVQIQKIAGNTDRLWAMTELLLLLLFVVGIIVLYLKGQSERGQENGARIAAKNHYVKNHEQFLRWVEAYELSEREKEVAWLVCRGFTNRQIAEELFIAETTVKKHVTHVYEKCCASGRKELKERWQNSAVS